MASGQTHDGRSPPMASCGTTGSGITSDDLAKTIKRVALSLGFNPEDYSTHSCRSGGATELVRAGVDPVIIQLFGRWLSKAFKRYTHLSPQVGVSMRKKLDEASNMDIDAAMI